MYDIERKKIPEFAILGHPNEGKSSVVSTLSEDDSVKISPVPGETVVCRDFPVVIDGKEIIRFIDTPGFQIPQKTLAWMTAYDGPGKDMINAFLDAHGKDRVYKNEIELLRPLANGAGIIYVVDGSRPMRKTDKAEMEILRLTGLPRMAIINCKQEEDDYLDEWKQEFRKHFNSIRIFNAHQATYQERISLLESLKSIDQDWQDALEKVIRAFKLDWDQRRNAVAEKICDYISTCILHVTQQKYKAEDIKKVEVELKDKYKAEINAFEQKAFKSIKKRYKHNIFNVDLPEHSIVNEDLFSEKTWQILGLTPLQLAAAAGVTGGILGAGLDVVFHGLSFGVFTLIGGAAGAGSAVWGKKLVTKKIAGISLGSNVLKIGPTDNIQLLYVLLDRVLIYYSYIINWAHSRRELPVSMTSDAYQTHLDAGYTTKWDKGRKNTCNRFFKDIRSHDPIRVDIAGAEFLSMLKDVLSDF